MSWKEKTLGTTDDFNITCEKIHNGKVRTVYWLSTEKSKALCQRKSYNLPSEQQLGIMIISDRISAFDCNWQGEEHLAGVPGKGAALNSIAEYWLDKIDSSHHIVDAPHPLMWVVKKAEPVLVEGVVRAYITGSMWRGYQKGERNICGNRLPENLTKNQQLEKMLFTPSTKGTIRGALNIPEKEDTNIRKTDMLDNYVLLGFKRQEDIALFEQKVITAFVEISQELKEKGILFVDTKFELGYIRENGQNRMIFIDEVGTPDSSRMWLKEDYDKGEVKEKSKEEFRNFLLKNIEKDILLNDERFEERKQQAATYKVPLQTMLEVSSTYQEIAEVITGKKVPNIENPRKEINQTLSEYGVIK